MITNTSQTDFSDETCIPKGTFEKKVFYFSPKIPSGIVVAKSKKFSAPDNIQYGIFAAKKFKKGDVIFITYVNIVNLHENQPLYFMFNIPGIGYVPGSFNEHMITNGKIGIYLSIESCLMNHSCNPNSLIVDTTPADNCESTPFRQFYKKVAIKDIKVGEEITCNYLLVCEGDSQGIGFECCCGSDNCYGIISGFKCLSPEKQKELLPFLNTYFKKQWGFLE